MLTSARKINQYKSAFFFKGKNTRYSPKKAATKTKCLNRQFKLIQGAE